MRYATLILLLWLTACAVPLPPEDIPDEVDTRLLLEGSLLGYESSPLPVVEVMSLTPEMKAWVAEKTGGSRAARVRLHALVQGLIDDGLLSLAYDDNLTRTAAETFNSRRGNCLSFSLLFAALAREADLEVTFQMVDIPPSFSASGDIVRLNNHINVLVRKIRSDTQFHQDHVVDFNTAEYSGSYDTRRVDDTYATALYHSNLGVEELQAGHTEKAFTHFRRALTLNPDIPGVWTNLGALYSMQGFKQEATLAYRKALALKPSYRSALINLSTVLFEMGEPALAATYRDRAQYHQLQNPYYHFHLARRHFDLAEWDEALEALSRAMSLKDDEHQFYLLQGLVYEHLGDPATAADSYEQAKGVVQRAELERRYNRKLRSLSQAFDPDGP